MKTFENYLEDDFYKDYHGEKDDAYDAFQDYLDRMNVSGVIEKANIVVKELNESYDRLRVLAGKLEELNEKAVEELKHINAITI